MKLSERSWANLSSITSFEDFPVQGCWTVLFQYLSPCMAVEAVGKRGEEHSEGGQGDSGGRRGEEHRTQDGMKVQN